MGDQTTKTLSFLSLNVCGLRKKLQYPDFVTFVCKYDILCLTETKTDNTDVINIPGFVVYNIQRKGFIKPILKTKQLAFHER